ncbi:MAG: GTPase HflX [Clostridia bacterium]|nr:GTPase HflX [Clostridia bacterium]MDQ7790641.1 GTPase HflX [Clostridia bacterium]
MNCVLVGLDLDTSKGPPVGDTLSELEGLAETSGCCVIGQIIQKRAKPDTAFYIGRGKVDEVAEFCLLNDASLVIFNGELSPAQVRNLEQQLDLRVIDRTQLILDIFASRARTREGKMQVELAQLRYLLPRLIGRGSELSRLGGGIGTRGPGETKLETDRRRIRKRIADLEAGLELVRNQRSILRRRRQSEAVPLLALVGYTNAGKSTLMNALTGASVLAENKLFATLDPTARRLVLTNNETIILTDTVGLIQRLPHHLVAAFRATLEEVVAADYILHVIDVSHRAWEGQAEAVEQVLQSLGIGDKPRLEVFNKVDLAKQHDVELPARRLLVSAMTGEGLDDLKLAVAGLLTDRRSQQRYFVPLDQMHLVSMIHIHGRVLKEEFQEGGVLLEAEMSKVWHNRVRRALNGEE